MLPPFPPSPPDGPPRGTYFSRRNATHPFPPSPAFTHILASSTNTVLDSLRIFLWVLLGPVRPLLSFPGNKKTAPAQLPGPLESSSFLVRGLGMLRWRYTDVTSRTALVLELHVPGDQGE